MLNGVAPDLEVDLEPAEWRGGHDTQLEKAVELVLTGMASRKYATPARPVLPAWAKDNKPPQQR